MSPATTEGRPFEVSESLYPFASHWRTIEQIPVHYVDEGSGPTLLFLHGNPTWSFLYRDIVRALRDDFRCVAVDYPGMGMSGKPPEHGRPDYGFTPAEHSRIVEGLVTELDLRDVTLMVQDWGGPIGLGMAGRQPDRIARLVIGNTWAWPNTGALIWIFSNGLGRGLGRWLILQRNLFVEQLLPAGCENKARLTREVMDAYRAPYPRPQDREPTAVFPREILGSLDYLREVESALEQLKGKPATIVWGQKDQAFRGAELARWRTLFPEARVRLLENAGHFIQEDAPDEIAEAIRELCASG